MKSFYAVFLLFLTTSISCFSADLKGIVKGPEGEPLQGVSVYLEGTSKGSISNKQGVYLIQNVQPGVYTLKSSLIGFNSATTLVTIKNDNLTIDLNLSILPVKVDEVIVTANKIEENIQNVPISISSLNIDKLQKLEVKKRGDLDGLSSNVRSAETGSHMSDMIIIRGMFPKNITGTSALFYFDGVPIFGYGQNPVNLFDIERIEVLKGPQGTLYGRSALAGVINITSVKPSNKTKINLGAAYGNYNNISFQAGVSGPLISDAIFARVSGFYSSRDGYFTNKFNGSNAGGSKGYGGMLNLGFYPLERFSAEIFGRLEYLDESMWPLSLTIQEAMDNDYEINRNLDSYIKKMNILSALKLNYKFDFLNIISTTSFQKIPGKDWYYDADFTPYDIISFKSENKYTVITEELRFEPKILDNLNLSFGLFYMNYKIDDISKAILGKDYKVNKTPLPVSPIYQHLEGPVIENNYAGFIHAKYTLFDKLGITAGLRYDFTKLDVINISYYRYNEKPIPFPPFNVDGRFEGEHKFSYLSQKYAIDYKLKQDVFIYSSASSGFNGGGINGSDQFPSYDPEYTWNYEVGAKTTWLNNSLLLNLSGFLIDWKDQQLLALGDLSSPIQTTTNAGKTRIPGLEIETVFIPFSGFMIDLNMGFMKAEIVEYKYDIKKGDSIIHFDYSGNQLPNAPNFSSFLNVSYEYPFNIISSFDKIRFNISHIYTDSYYSSHYNFTKVNPRNLLNARISFYTKNFNLSFWSNNILNYKYIYAVYEFRGGQNALLGAPRSFGLSLNINYELMSSNKHEL